MRTACVKDENTRKFQEQNDARRMQEVIGLLQSGFDGKTGSCKTQQN